MLYYAGIGPRITPAAICKSMTTIATSLSNSGWCLRSGHAEGADQAFEKGAREKQIFLPWEGFNDARSDSKHFGILDPTTKQIEIAMRHHPNWAACSDDAKRLLIRNVAIILGESLEDPATCVITWLPHAQYQGGTTHALKIASTYGIPVFDIREQRDQAALVNFTWEQEEKHQNKEAA